MGSIRKEREREGDGLHWVWDIAGEVGLGWWSRGGMVIDLMVMNIAFDCCTHMSGSDALLVFFLWLCDGNHSCTLRGLPSPSLVCVRIRAVQAIKNPSDDVVRVSMCGYRTVIADSSFKPRGSFWYGIAHQDMLTSPNKCVESNNGGENERCDWWTDLYYLAMLRFYNIPNWSGWES